MSFQFFVMDLCVYGQRLSDENIYAQLKRIMQMAREGQDSAEQVGILTASERDTWAKCRMKLMEGMPISQ